MWRRAPSRNTNLQKALSAKASGLFALDVEIMNFKATIKRIAARFMTEAKTDIEAMSTIIETEIHMPEVTATTNTTAGADVNTAIRIALALQSIDPSLTVDAVQAGTNAALTALYPAASA